MAKKKVKEVVEEVVAVEPVVEKEDVDVLLSLAFRRAIAMAATESLPEKKIAVIRGIIEKDFNIVRR